jgi:hypothetical protein
VSVVVSQRRAISALAVPSAANNNARACTTWRCGNTYQRAIASSSARWPSVSSKGLATITGMVTP